MAVYQYDGWTEAAYQTIQSPSTISKRVSKVEEELGAPIFLRGKGPHVALTEFGELMIPYIQRIVSLNKRVFAYAGSTRNKNRAELTVGYPPLIGTIGETEILPRFKFENPSVQINHVLRHRKDLLFMLQEGSLDCAFVLMVEDQRVHNDVLDVLLSSGIFVYLKHYSSPTVKTLIPFVLEYAAEKGWSGELERAGGIHPIRQGEHRPVIPRDNCLP